MSSACFGVAFSPLKALNKLRLHSISLGSSLAFCISEHMHAIFSSCCAACLELFTIVFGSTGLMKRSRNCCLSRLLYALIR